MTVTFLESGSDATQDLSFWPTQVGTVASATDRSYTGPRSVKCSTGAGASLGALARVGVLANAGRRISVRFNADTWAGAAIVLQVFTSGLVPIFKVIRDTSTGKLTIQPVGATNATGSTVVTVNTWNRICLSYYITDSTHWQAKLYLNGVLEATANVGTLLNTASSAVGVSADGAALGANANVWFDDVFVDDGASSSSQPDTGDIRVTAKRPFANGTTNGFSTQIGSGGSGYGSGHAPQVNEQPLSQTNGWSMVGAGSAITEEYNIEAASAGDVDISGMNLIDWIGWVFAKSALSETAQIVVGGTTSNISLTSTATLFQTAKGSTAYPLGTGTDIGIVTATTVTTVSLYECGVLCAYITAAGTATPSGVSVASAKNAPTETGDGNAAGTGQQVVSAQNAPSGSGTANVSVSGVSAASAVSAPTGSGAGNVAGAGVTTAGTVNAPVGSGAGGAVPTGVQAASGENAPTGSGSGNAAASGVTAASGENAPTGSGAGNASVAGVSVASSVGQASPVVQQSGTATPSGVTVATAVGQATANNGGPTGYQGGGTPPGKKYQRRLNPFAHVTVTEDYDRIPLPTMDGTARPAGVRLRATVGAVRSLAVSVARPAGVSTRCAVHGPETSGSALAEPAGVDLSVSVAYVEPWGVENPSEQELLGWTLELIGV